MVCNRCITLLRSSLESLPVSVEELTLGTLTVSGLQSPGTYSQLQHTLAALDFEIVEDRERKLVREIREVIREYLSEPAHQGSRVKLPDLLSRRLNMSYETLRDVFSAAEGMTIAAYVIRQRIGNVKEYMLYSRLPLTEIAYLTGYSSVFHLSAQFREITGMTPARFRQLQRPVAQA